MLFANETAAALSEWLQVGAWSIAILGGSVAALKALYEMRQNRAQRVEELRWRRANAAKDLLNELHHHALAMNAVVMMDWNQGAQEYEHRGKKYVIDYNEVLAALRKPTAELGEGKEPFIRDCFDWFFYYVDRIEHYIRIGLIEFEDVQAVFRIYARRVRDNKDVYDQFLQIHTYDLARKFFQRYLEAG